MIKSVRVAGNDVLIWWLMFRGEEYGVGGSVGLLIFIVGMSVMY